MVISNPSRAQTMWIEISHGTRFAYVVKSPSWPCSCSHSIFVFYACAQHMMDIHRHIPNEVFDIKTTPTHLGNERYSATACGQTYTLGIWRIPTPQWENGDDPTLSQQTTEHPSTSLSPIPTPIPNKSTLDAQLSANTEWHSPTTLYYFSASGWEVSQWQWRTWVSARARAGALGNGCHYTLPERLAWQECRCRGGERFSTVLQAQLEKCISCAETRAVQGDETLDEEEKEERMRRLAHGVECRFLDCRWVGTNTAAPLSGARARGGGGFICIGTRASESCWREYKGLYRAVYWRTVGGDWGLTHSMSPARGLRTRRALSSAPALPRDKHTS